MAIFKLGAFATAIVGSIGGTNFRRGVNNAIISNKSMGYSKTKLYSNVQLNPIAGVFRRWSKLEPSLRDAWNGAALNFQFPDKFGVMRNLTGRQLFTKLNIQLLCVYGEVNDPTGITSEIQPFTVPNSTVTTNQTEATVTISTGAIPQNYMIQAECKLGQIYTPSFTKRKVIFQSNATGNEILDLTDDFYFNFPYMGPGYTVMYYVTAINAFGFKSNTVASYADVDPD